MATPELTSPVRSGAYKINLTSKVDWSQDLAHIIERVQAYDISVNTLVNSLNSKQELID
jgi:hypothetical protein